MAKLTTPIPQDKIGESFVWRDWFQKLSDKVFGTLSTQDANNVSITGGSISNINFNGIKITNSTVDNTPIGSDIPSTGKFTSIGLGTPLASVYGGTGVSTATANYVFAGPTSGSSVAPTFRALVASDVPTLPYAPTTSGTSILYGNGSGGFSNVTIGSGITFVAGTLSATGSGGTVTSVTGTAPIASSGGTTPAISISQASTSTNGYLSSTDWNTFNNKQPAGTYVTSVSGTTGRITSSGGTTPAIDLASGVATPGTTGSSTLVPVITIDTYGRVTSITTAANPQGTVTSVTGTAPVVSSGGTTPAISMAAASTSTNGYLTSTDWNTFNNKGSGTVTSVTGTAPVVSSGGTTPAISMAAASTSTNGYLTSTDWNTFNGKQPAGSYLTAVTADAPLSGSGTSGSHLVISQATTSTNGYLSSTDWNTFNNKQAAGTYVTSLTVTNSNGFSGSFTSGATPALTVSTSITGLLFGNGTALAAATISSPLSYSSGTLSIGQSTTSTNGYLSSTDWNTFNNKQAVSAPVTVSASTYSVAATDIWIINNYAGTMTLTLPTASSYSGRVLNVQNYQAYTVVSASSNVVPISGGAAGTAILNAIAGDRCTLVSNGTSWLITDYTPNNILLLG